MKSEPVITPGEQFGWIEGGWIPRCYITHDSKPNALPTELSGPQIILFVVGWLLNAPATCKCISRTDLLRQLYVLPH